MAITITKQPESYTGTIGSTAVFSVKASGTGLTYQWQYLNPAVTTAWSNSTSDEAKIDTMTVEVATHRNGYKYRCVITDANGESVISDVVTLTVAAIVITKQPHSAAANVGDTVYFTVETEGEGLTYQWQFMNPDMGYWADSGMPGSSTASISVEVLKSRDGYKYRCLITDANGNQIRTNEVTLYIIDGTLSANKGLVSMSTLSDIAEAIRAKTESTDLILPPDMAAMVRSISADVLSGSYTLSGNVNYEFNLGVSLPRYSSYVFMVYKISGFADNFGGYNRVVNGVATEGMMACYNRDYTIEMHYIGSENSDSAAKAVITIDFDTGIISSPALDGSSGTWNWWYFEDKGASA